MGMYTKLNFILPLKQETPQKIKTLLRKMFNGKELTDREKPNHKFFKQDNVHFMNDVSYYFDGTNNSKIKYNDGKMVLHINCDTKVFNYFNFLEFITPYLDTVNNQFIGYDLYEEFNNPTLYFVINGEIQGFRNENIEGD